MFLFLHSQYFLFLVFPTLNKRYKLIIRCFQTSCFYCNKRQLMSCNDSNKVWQTPFIKQTDITWFCLTYNLTECSICLAWLIIWYKFELERRKRRGQSTKRNTLQTALVCQTDNFSVDPAIRAIHHWQFDITCSSHIFVKAQTRRIEQSLVYPESFSICLPSLNYFLVLTIIRTIQADVLFAMFIYYI